MWRPVTVAPWRMPRISAITQSDILLSPLVCPHEMKGPSSISFVSHPRACSQCPQTEQSPRGEPQRPAGRTRRARRARRARGVGGRWAGPGRDAEGRGLRGPLGFFDFIFDFSLNIFSFSFLFDLIFLFLNIYFIYLFCFVFFFWFLFRLLFLRFHQQLFW